VIRRRGVLADFFEPVLEVVQSQMTKPRRAIGTGQSNVQRLKTKWLAAIEDLLGGAWPRWSTAWMPRAAPGRACSGQIDGRAGQGGMPLKNHCGADLPAEMLSGVLAHRTSIVT
jgi:hypothetical protein